MFQLEMQNGSFKEPCGRFERKGTSSPAQIGVSCQRTTKAFEPPQAWAEDSAGQRCEVRVGLQVRVLPARTPAGAPVGC